MKNPSPIKRHQALVAFSRDHHFGLLLVWKIKQGLDNAVAPERISNYVLHFFEQDLKQHFEEEELDIFPQLPAGNAMRLRAENDHAVIRKLIAQLRTDPANKDLLLQFGQRLKEHIRFEERELFNAIQEIAGHQDAGTSVPDSNRRHDADASWDDHFWLSEKKCPL